MTGYSNHSTETWHRLERCAGKWATKMDAHEAKEKGYDPCGKCAHGSFGPYVTDGGPLGPTEDSTERDGPFSYTAEIHAFQHGLAVGFASVIPSSKLRRFVFESVGVDSIDSDTGRTQAMREVRKESQYATGGLIVGILSGLAIMAAIAYMGLEGFVAFVPESNVPGQLRA